MVDFRKSFCMPALCSLLCIIFVSCGDSDEPDSSSGGELIYGASGYTDTEYPNESYILFKDDQEIGRGPGRIAFVTDRAEVYSIGNSSNSRTCGIFKDGVPVISYSMEKPGLIVSAEKIGEDLFYTFNGYDQSSGKRFSGLMCNSDLSVDCRYAPEYDYSHAAYFCKSGRDCFMWGMVEKNGERFGAVWRNGELIMTTTGGSWDFIYDVKYRGGHIYACGIENAQAKIWRNNEILYNLTDSLTVSNGYVYQILFDGGDIYAYGKFTLKNPWTHYFAIWKNGRILYLHENLSEYFSGEYSVMLKHGKDLYYSINHLVESETISQIYRNDVKIIENHLPESGKGRHFKVNYLRWL